MADVPFQFVPQSLQKISSEQVDANFANVDDRLDALEAGGQTGGTVVESRKISYNSRPTYAGVQAPEATEFVDRKYMEATRGCRVGDIALTVNPNAFPNDYGVVWAKMEGQQLSQATYPAFYAICQSIGGTAPGRYNPAAGASAGNFVVPNWNGRCIRVVQGSNGALSAKVPNFSNANYPASLVGEVTHIQTVAEMAKHSHTPKSPAVNFQGQGTGSGVQDSGGSNGVFTTTGETGGGEAFNVVDPSFMALVWVRIK